MSCVTHYHSRQLVHLCRRSVIREHVADRYRAVHADLYAVGIGYHHWYRIQILGVITRGIDCRRLFTAAQRDNYYRKQGY